MKGGYERPPKPGMIVTIGGMGKSASIIFEVANVFYEYGGSDWKVEPLEGSSFYYSEHGFSVDFTPTGHIDSVSKQEWWDAEGCDFLYNVLEAYSRNTGV